MPKGFKVALLTKPKSAILFFLKLNEYASTRYDKTVLFPFKLSNPKRFKMSSTYCLIQKKSFFLFCSFQLSDFSFPQASKISFLFSMYLLLIIW